MDILFIHGNYPAQFRHLCSAFGANENHRTVFLTARQDACTDPLHGVHISLYEQHRAANSGTHHYLIATEEAVLQGQAVLRSIDPLLREGFNPRLIIFHGGMGLGLFLRDALPNAKIIGYFEWWFRKSTSMHLVENFDFNTQLSANMRNLPTLQELEQCDVGVVPTEWQKKQFPSLVHPKLNVIFDGIDTNFFHPPKKSIDKNRITISNRETNQKFCVNPHSIILTYATRGMEPVRGFPEFMRALPTAFKEFNNLEVFIAGNDRCAYSYLAPTNQGSWKNHLLSELGDRIPKEKIHFTGLLNYHDYRSLLWRSNLHCYFSRPYVTSWSLFEAASCGARLLVNTGEHTDNIIQEESAFWTELEEQDIVNNSIVNALKAQSISPRHSSLNTGFTLKECLGKWQTLLKNILDS